MSDLIRREDVDKAIRTICNLCGEEKRNNGVMCGACNLDSFVREYDDIPSAEPERRWIPVTEALPEERKNVLVTTIDGDIKVSYRSDVTYWWNIGRGRVVAWMPLPEPWRGD